MSAHNSHTFNDVVLDTQALLDWQFFHDPACAGWTTPSPAAGWRWLATAAMRDELAHVLARGIKGSWLSNAEQVLAFFDGHATLCAGLAPSEVLARALRCTDADDQKFIDLAVATGARWLVSRDRAVQKLRRRAQALCGLRIVHPADWRPGD